jgi:hypothetical protein
MPRQLSPAATEGHGHSRQTSPGSTLGAGKRKGMRLNMCRQSIVDTPLDLKRKLEEFDRTKDRSALINALIDQFLITRYDSATLIAKTKLAALEILSNCCWRTRTAHSWRQQRRACADRTRATGDRVRRRLLERAIDAGARSSTNGSSPSSRIAHLRC